VTATHDVTNQTPPLSGNAFQDDPLLLQAASGASDAQLREW
jgi:putative acyl-CoA dehydrogenase